MPSSMPNGMSVDEIIETIKMFKSSSNASACDWQSLCGNFNAVLPMEDRPRCKLDYKSGEIIIVEIPTPAHEGAIESVRQQVVSMDGGLQGYELRVVLEVGYSQKLDALQQKAKKWLSETCCREVILIEISNNRELLRGEIWRRNRLDNPIQTEDFSNVASANTQFLYLDLKNIYDNAIWGIPQFFRDPQRFPGLRIPIDLYIVRKRIQL
uniref:Restriction endonuclease domain-containing protein n=1 Tax=Ditylenchus dipsaci TaxID=166011 RepID=A0A915EAV5_9BILA